MPSAGLLKGLGAAISGTTRSAINLRELERRAQEDAKRLRLSMQSLELTKKRFAFEQKYRQQQAQAAQLRAALDAETRMVETARKREDRLELERVLHGYAKEMEGLRQAGREAAGTIKPSKPYGLETSTMNSILGFAKSEGKYGVPLDKTIKGGINTALRQGMGTDRAWQPGFKKLPTSREGQPTHVSDYQKFNYAPMKKTVRATKPIVDPIDDEIKALERELGLAK